MEDYSSLGSPCRLIYWSVTGAPHDVRVDGQLGWVDQFQMFHGFYSLWLRVGFGWPEVQRRAALFICVSLYVHFFVLLEEAIIALRGPDEVCADGRSQ